MTETAPNRLEDEVNSSPELRVVTRTESNINKYRHTLDEKGRCNHSIDVPYVELVECKIKTAHYSGQMSYGGKHYCRLSLR